MNKIDDMQPWEWPEPHWRGLVNQVRAGRPLRPATWKNGARCAVAFSFDSDHETNELRDGGKSIGRMAWGEYGARVGVPRILAMLRSTTYLRLFTCRPSRPCCIPMNSAGSWPKATKSVSTAGSTNSIRYCHTPSNAT